MALVAGDLLLWNPVPVDALPVLAQAPDAMVVLGGPTAIRQRRRFTITAAINQRSQ